MFQKIKSICTPFTIKKAFITFMAISMILGLAIVTYVTNYNSRTVKDSSPITMSSSRSSKSFAITQSDLAESSSSSSTTKSQSTDIASLYKQFDSKVESEANHSKEQASKQAEEDQKIKDGIQSAANVKLEADKQASLAREAQQQSTGNHNKDVAQSETNASTANALKALQETNQSQANHLKELESQAKQSQATSSSASSTNNSKNN